MSMETKKILVELFLIKNQFVGYGEFCTQLGHGLAERAIELKNKYNIELYFLVEKEFDRYFGNNVKYITMSHSLLPYLYLYPKSFDIFHETRQTCNYSAPFRTKNILLTVHDINFKYEKKGIKLQKYTKRFSKHSKKANYINYISNFVKDDVHSLFTINAEEKIIYNGTTDLKQNVPNEKPITDGNVPNDNFLFHISGLNPKKNIHLLIEMMQYLPNEKIVIAGNWNSEYGKSNKKKITDLGLNNVICLNNVNEKQKAWLYANCKAFCFPSLCEGFGLPPIEAMYFGKPVFLSNLTSLPEIGGNCAFYFDNLSPQNMAETININIKNMSNDLPEKLKANAAKFSWEKCIDNYINYYLKILNIK